MSLKQMLDTVYDALEQKKNNKVILVKPSVMKVNRACEITNFQQLCSNINRNPNMFKQFIETELGVKTSFNGKKHLTLKHSYDVKKITVLYEHFIKQYVVCSSCNNMDTVINKRNQCKYVYCKNCDTTTLIEK